jgi:serine protease
MSLSGQDPGGQAVNFYQDAVDRVRQAGVFIVAAAGNQQTSEPAVPAAVPGVMSVSALALTGDLAPYSNFGSTIDITAPGGIISVDTNGDGYSDGVLSTFFDEVAGQPNFKFYQGTSMASPHVAGLAALCLAVNPNLSVSQLENLLISTVTDIGEPGRDDLFGHGLINAAAAVQQAAGVDTNANLEVFPSVLNFGADQTRREVSVVNSGREDLVLNPPAVMTYDGTSWLSATLAAGGEPGVVVTVDRTGVATGRYAGRVTLTSNQDNRVVEVSMAVSTDQEVPDVGQVFVLLVNQATREAVAQAETSQSAGYSYRLSEVEPGAYILVAGTDTEGNGSICESDDFCGAYPVLSEPSVLEVTQESDLTDLDFALSFVGSDLDTTGANGPIVQFWDTLAADGIDALWRVE